MELSHNNSRRRREVKQTEKNNVRLAAYNRELQETLEELELAVPNSTDPEEKERGLAMIRRLKTELGYDIKKTSWPTE